VAIGNEKRGSVMENETNNELTADEQAVDPENFTVREQLRELVGAIVGAAPTEEELDNLARVWPLATHLLSSKPLVLVDEWIRSLPNELFERLFLLAEGFMECGDSPDWDSEFHFLAYALATHERRRCATDDETIAAARALVPIVGVEAQCRTGAKVYIEPYVLGKQPRAIPTKESETEH
jgi:hypothetical protein